MGTSSGYMPPNGADWTSLKIQIGKLLGKPEKKDLVMSKFVTALGGAEGFSSANKAKGGKGGSVGKTFTSSSARKTSQNILGFFNDIQKYGLEQTLQDRGIDFNNKTLDDVKEVLIEYFSEPSIDGDSDASSRAIATVMDKILENIETEEELENYFSDVISTEKSKNILEDFYAEYIYERFARIFFEDITKKSNQNDAVDILEMAKDTINSKISTYQCKSDLTKIDFQGQDGADFVQGVLQDILEIFEGE